MKKMSRFLTVGCCFLAFAGCWMSLQASAQMPIPASDTPGAVLWRQQYETMLYRQAPYLFSPITSQTLMPPEAAEIEIEEGVLPRQKAVQGMLSVPGGSVFIGPPEE